MHFIYLNKHQNLILLMFLLLSRLFLIVFATIEPHRSLLAQTLSHDRINNGSGWNSRTEEGYDMIILAEDDF